MNARSGLRVMHRFALAGVLCLLPGCVSLYEQRYQQQVQWSDGGQETVDVWLSQGSTTLGQPLLFLLDVLGTPVIILGETYIALAVWPDEDRAIAGGPVGYLLSLLPVFTCVPLDEHPSAWLLLDQTLSLPASEREVLRGLSDREGVEWLARHCQRQWGQEHPKVGENVRYWAAAVRLAPPRPANRRQPGH